MANIFDLFAKIKKTEAQSAPVTWIIAGLGNPGPKYTDTRHNVGFRALEELALRHGARVDRLRFRATTGECVIGGARALLLKPQTFMNLSGESIAEALAWYKLDPSRLLVLYDDATLPVGRLRVRKKGSDGGHNGIKSILYHTKTDVFPRVKIGVGTPPHADWDLAEWVLGKIGGAEIDDAIRRAADAAECVLREGADAAMDRFNASPTP